MPSETSSLAWIENIAAMAGFLIVYLSSQRYVNELRDKLLNPKHLPCGSSLPEVSTGREPQVRAWLSDWSAIQGGALFALFVFALFVVFAFFSVIPGSWEIAAAWGLLFFVTIFIAVMHYFTLRQDSKLLAQHYPDHCRVTLGILRPKHGSLACRDSATTAQEQSSSGCRYGQAKR